MPSLVWNLWGLRLLISICCWASSLLYAGPEPGLFDLGRWDQSQPLKLDGQWLYMPGRFVEPHEFEDILDHDHQDMEILSAGDDLSEKASFARYGTYILRLARPQNLKEMSLLHGLYFSSAKSQVFCRQQPRRSLTLNLGQVGASRSSSTPRISPFALQNLQELNAVPLCTELVIMLQVSSQHHSRFGLWLPPQIGRTFDFTALRTRQERSQAFFLGVLLLLSAYGASLVWQRRDKGLFYLLLGVFVLVLRTAAHVHAMETPAEASLWAWHFEKLGVNAAVYLVPYLVWKSLRRRSRMIDSVVVCTFLVQLLAPVSFWSAYVLYFQLLGASLLLLFLYTLIRSRGMRRSWVGLQALGLSLAAGGLVLATLGSGRLLDNLPPPLFEYGHAIWLFLQIQLIAQNPLSPVSDDLAWTTPDLGTFP